MPSCGGFFVDVLAFAIVVVAVWFGSPTMPLYSGVFIGWAMAELRILCSFKMVRDKLQMQNYNYLKPVFYMLLFAQMIVPAFITQHRIFTWTQIIYFIAAAVVLFIALVAIGQTL